MSVEYKVFFDTNALLYLLTADTAKADTAEAVIGPGDVTKVKVMNEFIKVCQRKLRMDRANIRKVLGVFFSLSSVITGSGPSKAFQIGG